MLAVKAFVKEYFDLRKDKENEDTTVDSIRKGVEFKGANLWILIFAVFMASLGLNVNSTAVIIGAMLISPLMGPIMGVGLSVGMNDFELMKRSLKSYFMTTMFCVITATIYFLFTPIAEARSELLARTSPSIYDVFIALLGGMAGVIALSTKEKGNVIPGVAIATALMPPLCTAGYGIASGNWGFFLGAFYLYFINSVFISVATFIGVRVLHFKRKEFVDKKRESTVKKYIILIAILTMAPATYLTFDIIKSTFYDTEANKFITEQLNFPDATVVDRSVNYENKEIKVILLGKEVPEASLAIARDMMKNYKLGNTKLTILQGMNDNQVDMSSMRAMLMEDFYTNSEQRLQEHRLKIDKLEYELDVYKSYDEISTSLIDEMKVLFPTLKSVGVSRMLETNVENMKTDTIEVALIDFEKKPGKTELDKLDQWLKARLKTDNLKLIVN